eukprot:7399410-Pyramimonas_sp.AAC.1
MCIALGMPPSTPGWPPPRRRTTTPGCASQAPGEGFGFAMAMGRGRASPATESLDAKLGLCPRAASGCVGTSSSSHT